MFSGLPSRRAPRHKRPRRAARSFPTPRRSWRPAPKATLLPDGPAAAPADAPPQVQAAIFAANKIVGKPYKYGGGHAKVEDSGYDCSGTVSYALHRGRPAQDARSTPRASCAGASAARASWITVYTNPGHAFVVIAGLRLDTSAAGDPSRRIARPPRRPALARRPAHHARLPRATPTASSRPVGSGGRTICSRSASRFAPAHLRLALAPRARRRSGLERRDLGRAPVVVERDHRQVGGVRVAHLARRAGSRPRRARRPPSTCARRR